MCHRPLFVRFLPVRVFAIRCDLTSHSQSVLLNAGIPSQLTFYALSQSASSGTVVSVSTRRQLVKGVLSVTTPSVLKK
jgi:hypothetical protein